jgi:hypothetical protein
VAIPTARTHRPSSSRHRVSAGAEQKTEVGSVGAVLWNTRLGWPTQAVLQSRWPKRSDMQDIAQRLAVLA